MFLIYGFERHYIDFNIIGMKLYNKKSIKFEWYMNIYINIHVHIFNRYALDECTFILINVHQYLTHII